MTDKDRVIERKKERQKTLDKINIESGKAYTYDTDAGQGSGCLSDAEKAREKNQEAMDDR